MGFNLISHVREHAVDNGIQGVKDFYSKIVSPSKIEYSIDWNLRKSKDEETTRNTITECIVEAIEFFQTLGISIHKVNIVVDRDTQGSIAFVDEKQELHLSYNACATALCFRDRLTIVATIIHELGHIVEQNNHEMFERIVRRFYTNKPSGAKSKTAYNDKYAIEDYQRTLYVTFRKDTGEYTVRSSEFVSVFLEEFYKRPNRILLDYKWQAEYILPYLYEKAEKHV